MNNMNEIMETWRSLLREDLGHSQQNGNEDNTLHTLVKKHYPEFVSGLASLIKNQDFLNFLRRADPNNPNNHLNVQEATISCTDLIPMQNIIGLDDSLAFEFKKPVKTKEKASGGVIGPETYDYMSRPIITCGRYIIDGHHRWSTVYMLNPRTQIKVQNITNFKDGTTGLKASQLIIAAIKGDVPISKPKGINVFTEGMKNISIWLSGHITQEFINQYLPLVKSQTFNKVQEAVAQIARDSSGRGQGKSSKQMCVNQIFKNIQLLRTKNAPKGDAVNHPRTIMPQYSDDSKELNAAKAGNLNLKAIKGALGAVNETDVATAPTDAATTVNLNATPQEIDAQIASLKKQLDMLQRVKTQAAAATKGATPVQNPVGVPGQR